MKYFLSLAIMLLFVGSSYGQYTFHATKYEDVDEEKGEKKTYARNQIFSISLADKYFVHTVLDETGTATDSQLYSIIEIEKEKDGDELWIAITVLSGLSGKKSTYLMEFNTKNPILAAIKSETRHLRFIGKLTTFKTYNQSEGEK